MRTMMSRNQIEALLTELCSDLGFCLSLEARMRLTSELPLDVEAFTDAVILEEGLDPNSGISLHLLRDIRSRVAKHYADAENSLA